MNFLELTGAVVGLIYLWLEYKASIWLWVASLVMPAIYIVVYYRAGLYADLGINVYYILASAYGLMVWLFGKKKSEQGREVRIGRTPRKMWLPLTAVSAVLTVVIAGLLIRFTDSNVPWADSFTTALSIVAMWMLARKYMEQWLVWMLVDVVCTVLYLYKGLYFTAGLFAIYTLIAGLGYWKWKKMAGDSATSCL